MIFNSMLLLYFRIVICRGCQTCMGSPWENGSGSGSQNVDPPLTTAPNVGAGLPSIISMGFWPNLEAFNLQLSID